MAILGYAAAFDRFAGDATFRSQVITGFKIWLLSKIQDSGTPEPYKTNYKDLYGRVLKASLNTSDLLFVTLFQAISQESSFWENPITDLQVFDGFSFVEFPILFAFGYVDSPVVAP